MSSAAVKEPQPAGLYVLFLTEMWERFSYYGMRALLILYLTAQAAEGGLGFDKESAGRLYGYYTSLVYLTPLVGGWLADRFIGTNRSMIIGGLIIACGHFSLAMPSIYSFYLGLGLIIIGTGFFKPTVSTMVGQLYRDGDPRRDAGFTIFYMGINLGALLGILGCGYLGESPQWGWHYGFGAAGVGMVLGLIAYVFLRPKYLAGVGDPPNRDRAAALAASPAAPLTPAERDQILAIFIVAFFVIFFWMSFEQAGSSMNLFAKEHTARTFLGFEFPASWFQSINSALIIIGGPIFAWLWSFLGARGKEPSTPLKMALGLFLVAGGFVFMVLGAEASKSGALVSPFYLIMAYTLHTLGELCLSPVGLSLVTKLAPKRFAALLMGTWFLANTAANFIAGFTAGAIDKIGNGDYFRLLGGQSDFYLIFVVAPTAAGVIFVFLIPLLKKLMHGHS